MDGMTYRQRRLAKAERLRGWADKREDAATAALESVKPFTSDYAFNTQPGHIPERARIIAREDRAYASLRKAAAMDARADGIEAQAARSIYSDDPDAVERLRDKLAALEAERSRWVEYNKSARKAAKSGGVGDVSILDDAQREDLYRVIAYHWQKLPGRAVPSYVTANLGGNISRLRQRIESLTR